MKAVILAAGEGVRMRPLTLTKPKPMLRVLDKPLLHHIFDVLPDAVDEIILIIGYKGDQIQNYFGDHFGRLPIRYIHQEKPLGTGHGLYLAREFLGGDRFLMLYADDLQSKEDLGRLLQYPLALLTKEMEDPRRFGVVVVDNEHNIVDVVEKPEIPPSRLASTGAKALDSRIFNYPLVKSPSGEYYITNPLSCLLRDHKVKAVNASFWLPIGYPEDIAKAEEILKTRLG